MDEEILYNIIEEKCKFEFQVMELKIKIERLSEQNSKLQSKIDKANEILDKLEMQPVYLDCKYYELDGFNELKNTLKEDK